MLGHITGLFFNPESTWREIKEELDNGTCKITALILILALIPPISGYLGTTLIGWQIGSGEPVKLTSSSAGTISVLYFLAIIAGRPRCIEIPWHPENSVLRHVRGQLHPIARLELVCCVAKRARW